MSSVYTTVVGAVGKPAFSSLKRIFSIFREACGIGKKELELLSHTTAVLGFVNVEGKKLRKKTGAFAEKNCDDNQAAKIRERCGQHHNLQFC